MNKMTALICIMSISFTAYSAEPAEDASTIMRKTSEIRKETEKLNGTMLDLQRQISEACLDMGKRIGRAEAIVQIFKSLKRTNAIEKTIRENEEFIASTAEKQKLCIFKK